MNPLGSFADDTKLLKAINSLLQNHQLQEYLDHVYHWSDLNNMFFNEDKFVHIHYSTDQNPPIYFKPSKSVVDSLRVGTSILWIIYKCETW